MFLYYSCTNFRENLFSREFFSRSRFSKISRELIFANFANLRFFEYFAVTYIREFIDLAISLHFYILLGYFREFRDEPILRNFARTNLREFREKANFENFVRTYFCEFRECRPNRENKFSRKLVLAKISTAMYVTQFFITKHKKRQFVANKVRFLLIFIYNSGGPTGVHSNFENLAGAPFCHYIILRVIESK